MGKVLQGCARTTEVGLRSIQHKASLKESACRWNVKWQGASQPDITKLRPYRCVFELITRQMFRALLIACSLINANSAEAMDIKTVRDQMILSGPVNGDELDRVRETLSASPEINTVILRNSGGGNALAGYRVGELLRERGLRTAVSGFCYSSCSRMFLGGRYRHFSDDYPPEYTNVGFHGHYGRGGRLDRDAVDRLDLRSWIIQHSDGRADIGLVERWAYLPYAAGMVHFYHPLLVRRHDASTFLCDGPEPEFVFDCEPISRTALELGVITSTNLVRSNDWAAVQLTIASKPNPSAWSDIADIDRLPLATIAGRAEYRRFLRARLPRAFAVSPNGQHWAWNSSTLHAMAQALERCAQRSGVTCELYAVDEVVVWQQAR